MANSRAVPLQEDTTITLEDGTQFRTLYDSAMKRHIVTCNICFDKIKLAATANSYPLEKHRKTCQQGQDKLNNPRFRARGDVFEASGSFDLQLLFRSASASFESRNNTNRIQVECPGQWVQWSPGSIWETYPFRLHKSKELGWTPIGIDDMSNALVLRARRCWKQVDVIDDEDGPGSCAACKGVPHSIEFRKVVERARDVKEHTPWMYLTDQQKERLMRQMTLTIRRLRVRIFHAVRGHRVLKIKMQEYKRIMMLIASNDVPRLNKLLSVSLRHGNSATAIAAQIQRAIDGLYSPRGGFTQRELDVAFLCQAIGGRRLLYALGKSHGLPSEASVRRTKTIPRLLPSIGVPTMEEIEQNIVAFLDPTIKPPPASVNGMLPGNTLGFDGVSIQKKCRYCPKRGTVLGLCREHSHKIDTRVTDSTIIGKIWDALESQDMDTKVCWGSEATVVVVALYSRNDHYSPTPLVISPTDKSETGDKLGQWIQVVIDTWNNHENGALQNGPLWSIASDGDAVFRRARHDLCNRYPLDKDTPLGQKLQPLLGLNLNTSKEIITATCDPKHIFKRFATLLRSTGTTIKDCLISSSDIREQLIKTLEILPTEVNDLLNTQDKQNVPKAVKLLRYLNILSTVPPPSDNFRRVRFDYISFIGKVFSFFVEPFVDVRMNLNQQLESLSTFSHLAVALQLEHGTAFLPGPLFADSQAVIKNIFFIVARLQLISPELTFYIIHEGTDRLERLFGDCRTLGHGSNFDILQLSEKMAIACLINSTFERNSDLDRGHRRLDLSSTLGIDHINPASWLGDTRVGGVDLKVAWNNGRDVAIEMLQSIFDADKVKRDFDFTSIYSHSNRDMLRPDGIYIGIRATKEGRKEKYPIEVSNPKHVPAPQNPVNPIQQTPFSIVPATSGRQDTADMDNAEEEFGLEEDLPDNPHETLKARQSFLIEGKEANIDSALSSIHPDSWRQMSDRVYRVRGWSLEHFNNTSKVDALVDVEDVIDGELLKVYDVVGLLVRANDTVCFAVMEVKSFTRRDGKKKVVTLSAKYSDLTSEASNYMVSGQIMKLIPSEKLVGYWEWAKEYIDPLGRSKDRRKKRSLTIEVPSHLIQPLTVHMISHPSEPRTTRLQWALATEELEGQMMYAWQLSTPEFNNGVSGIELIPTIDNSEGLPYCNKDGQRRFVVKKPSSEVLRCNQPLLPEQTVHCLVCGVTLQLKKMREHVGQHILWDMRGQLVIPPSNSDFDVPSMAQMGIIPCGFCGLDDCLTKLTTAPGNDPFITSDCIYRDVTLNYQAVSKGEANGTICSNIPIHCTLCPLSPDGEPQTIWKYNTLMHIALDHEYFDPEDQNLCVYPDIPVSMQVEMHISRAEEATLGIQEKRTMDAQADFKLMNSDDLPLELPKDSTKIHDGTGGKWVRADTQSTIQWAVTPPSKKHHF
ncbi:hypothetical protein AGABI2DRAFT_121753 [Agaricus bisporus var. bisporus H97]|uniref:hypothetical protein n=1 Tax=Agaricus bisporus var. bisporus (strain H97 / ATCC MYA-4626 / FGSC 10389) TaxID=936046 RepID=UPI00029F5976|nr:hypothetical protein AGABI2DRAFT_121753 [Agaricus bisporus var. bisporus H97]EKV43609.1 hypothetical protein AGABI2DRAFT_121753 [Agaricus bisporus var. bisporus H97]